MSFFDDLQSAISGGLSGSDSPYLQAAGGLLGGGGGSGPVVVAAPPPLPPPPPAPPAAAVGVLSGGLGWIVGGIALVTVAALAYSVRPSR